MTISDEELDELKRLLEKASESPWRVAGKSSGYIFAADGTGTVQVGVIGSYRDPEVLRFNKERWDADRNLIVLLRNLAPRLLSHYRSARNDGIEKLDAEHYRAWNAAIYKAAAVVRRVGGTRARQAEDEIRDLGKSPPQSEPGTEDVKP